MNSQQLATALLQLLPRVQIPMAPENIQAAGQIYDTLGKMARGELILCNAPVSVPNPPAED